ncbi:SpaA isopeptide-forming pilin-related protein [Virgibacillus sp. LDC-1]|uniref:SpaA isopeptide-forming pilin-related protein n=1 Tax=Virgibacillus sp. LDC-1 TaxID=3039856 RepID=UPI0024DE5E88|nr:SpaA isopeptide-forming pilin-related protein [Virgibacillus sp. LDC-1]
MNVNNMITPLSGNLNVDIDLAPKRTTTLAGNDATYMLTLKFTGSRTAYTNAEIVVDLPITDFTDFTQDLSELKINGVTPIYNQVNKQLIYALGEIKTGRTYETILKINTNNGVSPNGYALEAGATFQATEQPPVFDNAVVNIEAASATSVSKKFIGVQNNDRNLPSPGAKTLWKIKLDIPKKDTGQMFLKEGSQIIMTDTLPAGLSYDSMESGPEPVQNGNVLTWQFDAPTLNEQSAANSALYSQTVQVWLTVNTGTVNTTQTNQVDVETTYIDDSTRTTSGQDKIDIVDSSAANGHIDGSWYVPVHVGPADGKGKVAPNSNQNPNPIVYDDALLGFSHGIAPLKESEPGDFQSYTTIFRIDSNLIFERLTTPGGFIFRPNANYPSGIPLNEQPRFNIVASVNGQEKLLVENAEHKKHYTRSDLGLLNTDKVDYIKYDFTYAPSGMLNGTRPYYYFGIKEGYTGEVVNTFNVYGVDANGSSFNHRYDEEPRNTIAGPRSATIAPKPVDQPPIAYVGVKLLDENAGEVVAGGNRMQIGLDNASTSTIAMNDKLEAVVLMPPGVSINNNPNPNFIDKDGQSSQASSSAAGGSFEILNENYNGSGRQLVRVVWNDNLLRPGNKLVAELDVTVSTGAPNSLLFNVYGFSGDDQLDVPTSDGTLVTDTVLETDTGDLNENGITDEPRLKSGNRYFMRGEYNIETEKLVKGELDTAFSLFGHTLPGGSIDYQLKLTNTSGKDISSLTLIDVLPSVGDLGITDNVDRGSRFTPLLTGEIVLPSSWKDRVDVFYSTAENPKRDDLIRKTDYPDTTQPLSNPPGAQEPNWMKSSEVTDWTDIHSFKIQSKNDEDWLDGESILISFSMQAPLASDVPEDILDESIDPTSRAAWNSFAIATDQGQPVEPLRVGVYMSYDNSVSLLKVTKEGTPLEGAEFKLLDDLGNELRTGLVTNADGKIIVEGLPIGNYTFVETKAPTGYEQDSTPIPFSIDFVQQAPIELVFENSPIPGSVELTKVGEKGEILAGAEFKLLDDTGKELQAGLVTAANGKLVINDLQPGNYQLVETKAPFGYQLDETPIPFEIVFNQQEAVQLTLENKLIPGVFELTKQGEGGETLEGVVFELQDAAGNVIREGLTTNAEGKIILNDLTPGAYQLVETKTILGYVLDSTPIPFEIGLGQAESTKVTFTNLWTTGSIELTKVGEAGEVLAGAEFKLLDDTGNELQASLVTNEKGMLVITELKPGNYQLIETKAPFGYVLDSTPIPFEIGIAQSTPLKVAFENKLQRGSLQIIKVDADTDATLAGAEFEVKDQNGNVVQVIATNAAGIAVVNNLKPGDYTITETKAPSGYVLASDPILFTIELGQKEPVELIIENTAKEVPPVNPSTPVDPPTPVDSSTPVDPEPEMQTTLPQTGEEWLRYLYILGMSFMGAGALLLFSRKRRRIIE